MTIESLKALQAELQPQFDTQTNIKQEAENEQLRLQGENRMITKIIEAEEAELEKQTKSRKKVVNNG